MTNTVDSLTYTTKETAMPNRIIKESIRESYSIDSLSPQAEVLFYRLITYAEDHGLFKADPKLLNKALFPLKNYSDDQIIIWLNEIAQQNIIEFYLCDDKKPYGYFIKWDKHQVIRNKKAKLPSPHENKVKKFSSIIAILKSIEINCNQLNADENICVCNPIQSNPIQSNKNPITRARASEDSPCDDKHETSFESLCKKQDRISYSMDDVLSVLNHLNNITHKHHNSDRSIKQRLLDGYTVDQMKHVIDVKTKYDPHFIENPNLLRPSTLFGDKEKFDAYLNETPDDFMRQKRASIESEEKYPPDEVFTREE